MCVFCSRRATCLVILRLESCENIAVGLTWFDYDNILCTSGQRNCVDDWFDVFFFLVVEELPVW